MKQWKIKRKTLIWIYLAIFALLIYLWMRSVGYDPIRWEYFPIVLWSAYG